MFAFFSCFFQDKVNVDEEVIIIIITPTTALVVGAPSVMSNQPVVSTSDDCVSVLESP